MRTLVGLVTAAALALGPACAHRLDRKIGPTLQTVDMSAPYLKVHMRNGEVFILEKWTIDEVGQALQGGGVQLGANRRTISQRPAPGYRIRFADVALYETNTVVTSPGVAAMAVITGISVAVTVACLTNPKACFGSCPTFYARSDDGRSVLQAEGFSDAIAPSLEKHDLDALWRTTGAAGPFTLRMTNEAYETHVIKQADVLAVRRPPGGRVLATDDELWLASVVEAPRTCAAPEGNCLEPLRAVDASERTSLTDGEDLAARETIELGFAPSTGQAAVVIAARQSLVTTFLLYQGLSYLGTKASTWFAAFERGDPAARLGGRALDGVLGGIEVQVERDGGWQTVGEAYETGPLATDVHLVMLPAGVTGEHVRLRLPMGGWRIDHVALATITGKATPVRIAPRTIRGEIGAEFAGGRVAATGFPIVTLPGDAYDLTYDLPAGGDDYELFLDSRGYYLEWMRSEWMREEKPLAAMRMFLDPAQALRDLAPVYKRLEPDAEAVFWRSRYARP